MLLGSLDLRLASFSVLCATLSRICKGARCRSSARPVSASLLSASASILRRFCSLALGSHTSRGGYSSGKYDARIGPTSTLYAYFATGLCKYLKNTLRGVSYTRPPQASPEARWCNSAVLSSSLIAPSLSFSRFPSVTLSGVSAATPVALQYPCKDSKSSGKVPSTSRMSERPWRRKLSTSAEARNVAAAVAQKSSSAALECPRHWSMNLCSWWETTLTRRNPSRSTQKRLSGAAAAAAAAGTSFEGTFSG
mmetsp:Transcript_32717/g.98800  ORF Transcript_32717/g.98800 Transcript_32717/m.98800 type:complete len:251 (+) Transcript_32717:305-1057(+)